MMPTDLRVLVTIKSSGIANILTFAKRPDADELRRWLKDQRCRVGPIFEPNDGDFSFFVYSKRRCGELIEKHGGFVIQQ